MGIRSASGSAMGISTVLKNGGPTEIFSPVRRFERHRIKRADDDRRAQP